MQRLILRTLAALSLALSSLAMAAPITIIDDAHFGADSVLVDTDHNLKFLRLDLTLNLGYDGVVAQLGAGGTFSGWRVATLADMLGMGGSLGLAQGSTDTTQVNTVTLLRSWFCPPGTCVQTSSTHKVVRGLISDTIDLGGGRIEQEAFTIGTRYFVDPDEVDFRVCGFSQVDPQTGVYLVQAVPLPAAVWMLAPALCGLITIRRRARA